MNCNFTKDFLEAYIKLCADSECASCALDHPLGCITGMFAHPDKAIETVQAYADTNKPSFLDRFKKEHPNAPMDEDGAPMMCPYSLGYFAQRSLGCEAANGNCTDCWNLPLKAITDLAYEKAKVQAEDDQRNLRPEELSELLKQTLDSAVKAHEGSKAPPESASSEAAGKEIYSLIKKIFGE